MTSVVVPEGSAVVARDGRLLVLRLPADHAVSSGRGAPSGPRADRLERDRVNAERIAELVAEVGPLRPHRAIAMLQLSTAPGQRAIELAVQRGLVDRTGTGTLRPLGMQP